MVKKNYFNNAEFISLMKEYNEKKKENPNTKVPDRVR